MSSERREELELLYPWYKEEVFRRRERMMGLTACASAVLLFLLIAVLAIPGPVLSGTAEAVMLCVGVVLFSGVMVYVIIQQRVRHLMAKQVLIAIERELGLYEEGRYLPETALYPKEWQTAWRHDASVIVYLSVLAVLTGLVIAAVLLR
jgi:hypothetical protein